MMSFLMLLLIFWHPASSTIPLLEGLHQIYARNAAELRKIGENCTRQAECVSGAVCAAGSCRCKMSHVAVEEQCWKKVPPGHVGCTHSEQCQGVWPGTSCQKGQCECSAEESLIETREGNVCVKSGNCPTNGKYSALYERGSNGRVSSCITFTGRPGNFIGCDEYPEVYDCISGICCPTRGIACSQPKSAEIEANGIERFWYDSEKGQCSKFRYSGSGGNANNFETLSQCESYCMDPDRCERGDPIPESSITKELKSSYFCNSGSSGIICCPTRDFICSTFGGINLEQSTLRPFSIGSGSSQETRWYYNPSDMSCHQFSYQGQGGNFNNFGSKKHCLSFCTQKLCGSYVSPLRDPSDNIQKCSSSTSSTSCPESHECRNSVCCPRPATICLQALHSLSATTCTSQTTVTRWTYSVEHSMCKSILANRCTLGDNQFDSLEECQSVCSSVQAQPRCPVGRVYKGQDGLVARCSAGKPCPAGYECVYAGNAHVCCPAKDFTCAQPLSPGTTCGTQPLQRWHYNPSTNACTQFEYAGCNGNDNNFVTRLECVETCFRSECPDGGEPLVDSSNGQTIACDRHDDCPSTHTCSRQLYTNRTACCPSRKWVCSHEVGEGAVCGTPSKRYYFDKETSSCRQFQYLGCGGNPNSFATRAACYQYCQSASCSSSEIVYQPSNLDSPFDCSLKSCPRHFACVRNVWSASSSDAAANNVCCGSANHGVCPSTQHPWLDATTQQPATCTPNVQNSCPLGFQCVYSSIRTLYFCCRDVVHVDKCLKGSRPELWPSTAEPRACNMDAQCAPSTSCYTPVDYSSGLCCASVDEVCPPHFIYDQERSEAEQCSPLEKSSCGQDGQSVCLYSDAKNSFVCCRRETRQVQALAKCPPGSIVELTKTYCDPENSCPMSHFCMKKSADRVGICCRHPSLKRTNPIKIRKIGTATSRKPIVFKYRCPKPSKLLRLDGEPVQCGADDDCPEFHKCSAQPGGSQSVCCGLDISEICPSRVYPPIKVKRCSLCGAGYECRHNYCCPLKEVACAAPVPDLTMSNPNEGSKRFYYDSATNTCHSFLYSYSSSQTGAGTGVAQNHFADHESCLEMCATLKEESLNCPHPYQNPLDHPQICTSGQLKSCADSETCLRTQSGSQVCCQHPPSFQMLMSNLCGANYVPQLNKSGNPVRCSSSNRCQSRICRQSPVLRYSICCQRRSTVVKSRVQGIRPLADGAKSNKLPICRSEAESSMGTCLPKLFPGESECERDEQCVTPATCQDRKCVCPKGTVQFRRMCAAVCPIFYKNQNGVCV